jgi:hypothetical protein
MRDEDMTAFASAIPITVRKLPSHGRSGTTGFYPPVLHSWSLPSLNLLMAKSIMSQARRDDDMNAVQPAAGYDDPYTRLFGSMCLT